MFDEIHIYVHFSRLPLPPLIPLAARGLFSFREVIISARAIKTKFLLCARDFGKLPRNIK